MRFKFSMSVVLIAVLSGCAAKTPQAESDLGARLTRFETPRAVLPAVTPHIDASLEIKKAKPVFQTALEPHLKKAQRSIASVSGDGVSARCQIEVASCPTNATAPGFFFDSSATGSASCLARAQYWHDACQTDKVTASYWADKKLIKDTTYQTACQVSQASCPNVPANVGTVSITDVAAISNPISCMALAASSHDQCGGFDPSVAAFYINGKLAQQVSSAQASSCMISQSQCAKYPNAVGTFQDTGVVANQSANSCLADAGNYLNLCGGAGATTAAFYSSGKLVTSATVGTACRVQIAICDNHADYVGDYFVSSGAATTDQKACVALQATYQQWCATTSVATTFYIDGQPAALAQNTASSKSVAPVKSGVAVIGQAVSGRASMAVISATVAPNAASLTTKAVSTGSSIGKSVATSAPAATTSTTSSIAKSLPPVRMLDAAGSILTITGMQVHLPANASPSVPANLSASSPNSTTLTVSWTAAGGTTASYVIAIIQGATPPSCAGGVNVGNTTSYSQAGLQASTSYAIALCAVNSSGVTSAAATLVTSTAAPTCVSYQNVCVDYENVCTDDEETCTDYEEECSYYDDVCTSSSTYCASYSEECEDYDDEGNCDDYEDTCDDYETECDSYSEECQSYSEECVSTEDECVSYQEECQSYQTECTQTVKRDHLKLRGNDVLALFDFHPTTHKRKARRHL